VVISNMLIGLREGLEAGLIVTILAAFLIRTGRRSALMVVWAGVAGAIVASIVAGALLTFTAANLTDRGSELFEAATAMLAVALITGMVFWMRHPARAMERELQGQMSAALRVGPLAVFTVAFLAVLREGLEMAVFVLVAAQEAGTGTLRPLLGFLVGVAAAVALTWLLYLGVVRINMARFLTVTGVLLIFVAAGVLTHGVHDLQEASVLPGLNVIAFDISAAVPLDTWHGSLLKGIFNFTASPTVLALVAWLVYLVTVLPAFLLALRGHSARGRTAVPAAIEPVEAVGPTGTAKSAEPTGRGR
jgi:high-affinity iron transporter